MYIVQRITKRLPDNLSATIDLTMCKDINMSTIVIAIKTMFLLYCDQQSNKMTTVMLVCVTHTHDVLTEQDHCDASLKENDIMHN